MNKVALHVYLFLADRIFGDRGAARQEVEATATENKGTVLIESSDQLMNYNRSEEIAMEAVR